MPNALGLYDPLFYANEALIQLEQNLGMAGAVYRGYDKDPAQKGSTIKIRRPGTFQARQMPASSATDVDPDEVTITVDQWWGDQFKLTDKELSFTQEDIIREHIRPLAYAIARKIDSSVNTLYADIPHVVDADATDPYKDFTGMRRKFRDNNVPGESWMYEIGGAGEEAYLNTSLFHQADTGAGGAETQVRGTMGRKFGFDTFVNQNVPSHVAGSASLGSGSDFAVESAASAGATSIELGDDGDSAISGDLNKGDVLTIAGNRDYVVTADTTLSGATSVPVSPALTADLSGGEVVTIRQEDKTVNLGFHRNAFALAMAPLSDLGNQLGARIETVSSPESRLSLRSSMWYEEKDSEIWVRIDALWGVKTLDPDLAVRLER